MLNVYACVNKIYSGEFTKFHLEIRMVREMEIVGTGYVLKAD